MTTEEKAVDRFGRELHVGDKVFYISGEYNSSKVYVEPVKISQINLNKFGQLKVQIDRGQGYTKSSVIPNKVILVSTKGIKF